MEFQTRPDQVMYKYECHYKDDVRDFTSMIDELMRKHHRDKDYVLDSIGITEKDLNNAKFNPTQFRKAINFYFKEKWR